MEFFASVPSECAIFQLAQQDNICQFFTDPWLPGGIQRFFYYNYQLYILSLTTPVYFFFHSNSIICQSSCLHVKYYIVSVSFSLRSFSNFSPLTILATYLLILLNAFIQLFLSFFQSFKLYSLLFIISFTCHLNLTCHEDGIWVQGFFVRYFVFYYTKQVLHIFLKNLLNQNKTGYDYVGGRKERKMTLVQLCFSLADVQNSGINNTHVNAVNRVKLLNSGLHQNYLNLSFSELFSQDAMRQVRMFFQMQVKPKVMLWQKKQF